MSTTTYPTSTDAQAFTIDTEPGDCGGRDYLVHTLASRDGGLTVQAFDYRTDRPRSHGSIAVHGIDRDKLTARTFTSSDGTPSITVGMVNSSGQHITVTLWGITPAELVAALAPTLTA